ncbi:MAG TPA: Yip1 family protein [Terracidiphilus sp.]|nr:Yip1 family protein [Terracidiphilus sp.]
MSQIESPAGEAAGLTQMQRFLNIFTAPSRTFEDIRRGNRSWWLPFIVLALIGYIFFAVVDQKVGMQQVVENQIRLNPRAQERMADATPEQRARSIDIAMGITEGMFIGAPLVGMISAAVVSLGLLATINFLFGGRASYGQVFAMSYYAWLPMAVKSLLGIVVLYAGIAPESFNVKNFSPTNIGAFLDPLATNKAFYSLATSLDIVTIWTLVLMGMGLATVAGVKRRSGYIAVFGWWGLFVLIGAGWAAFN